MLQRFSIQLVRNGQEKALANAQREMETTGSVAIAVERCHQPSSSETLFQWIGLRENI